jgi:protein-S-isoprenylcysteine O-methyltransferase Ste14
LGEAAHNRSWQIAEIVFVPALLGALALQWAVPLSLPRASFTIVFVALGGVLMIAGAMLVVSARRELKRQGQPIEPGTPTSAVVTSGVFAHSRNPLYLGGVLFLFGLALAANLPWLLVLLVPAIIACNYILIVPEERYLSALFGAEYQAYTTRVRRWIGRSRR